MLRAMPAAAAALAAMIGCYYFIVSVGSGMPGLLRIDRRGWRPDGIEGWSLGSSGIRLALNPHGSFV